MGRDLQVLPNVDEDIAPFWEATKERRFVLLQCKTCGAFYWPAAYCRNHRNEPLLGSLEWTVASGLGRVFAFNVHYVALSPALIGRIPVIYALIELQEGPIFGTNVIGAKPDDVYVGMPVEIAWDESDPNMVLPKFQPVLATNE
jgi:uncharacterized OB-fold protein